MYGHAYIICFFIWLFSEAHNSLLVFDKNRLFQKVHYCTVDEISHVRENLGPRDMLHNQLNSPSLDMIIFI